MEKPRRSVFRTIAVETGRVRLGMIPVKQVKSASAATRPLVAALSAQELVRLLVEVGWV